MRKLILALVLTLAACLALAAAAFADPGPIQVSGQDATTQQQSGAASSAAQVDPSNSNISIRVLSPGNDGDVSQSNTASSSATSGNQAGTTQTAGQTAGGSGIQSSQQQAGTDQLSAALSAAAQAGASNANLPVRVLSPGNDGSVTQSNGVDSQATSGNAATTGQTAAQSDGSSCGCGSAGIQTGKQDAGTGQASGAASDAKQIDPSNTNVSIRVLSPGNGGDVSQSNSATSNATSGNTAATTQNATQSQAGTGGCGCTTTAAPAPACGCSPAADPTTALATPVGTTQSNTDGSTATSGNEAGTGQASQQSGSGTGIQTGYQSAGTEQSSGALSDAKQIDPSNTAGSVRVLSPGNDGGVTQSNSVSSKATSGNTASTTQTSNQAGSGSCGCGTGPGAIQVAGQDAWTGQESLAGSAAAQFGASNDASPVRVLSPGNGGDVSQSNDVSSTATSGNAGTTSQTGNQLADGRGCGCGNGAIQVLGQQSRTEQGSAALSAAIQAFGGGRSECGCGGGSSGNDASPVRVWSPGNEGDVTQSNSDTSTATSGNTAGTTQKGWQGAGGNAIQVAGQQADTGQASLAASLAAQLGASNDASPVRVYSPGNGGSVSQDNTAGSTATSGNGASTGQSVGQLAGGSPCGCSHPIQVAGQKADTGQLSKALSAAFQIAAANGSVPTWVESYGNDGSAAQDNTSSSLGTSGNRAGTAGEAMQKS